MVPEPVAYYLPSLFVCGAVGLALQPINRRQQSNDLYSFNCRHFL